MLTQIVHSTWFDGPNIWNKQPVFSASVRLQETSAGRASSSEAIAVWLVESLSSLVESESRLAPLDLLPFSRRAGTGAQLAQIAVNLQRLAGVDCRFASAIESQGNELPQVVFESHHPRIGEASILLALRVMDCAQSGVPFSTDLRRDFNRGLCTLVAELSFSGISRAIVATARKRGIPVTRIDELGQLAELGNGQYRQHLMGARSSHSSETARRIADDKFLASQYLRAAGLPVPDSRLASTADQAALAADKIGYPVVLKPSTGASSLGVHVNLRTAEVVRKCFETVVANTTFRHVVVESYHRGNFYRVGVVNNQVISVVKRELPSVTGDGIHSVRGLIDLLNEDPRRGSTRNHSLSPIAIDRRTEDVLADNGLSLESIPANGQSVPIKPFPSGGGGGLLGAPRIDVTHSVHPENIDLIIQAVRTVGCDLCTLDLVSPDMSVPMRENGGVIIEINASSVYTNVNDSDMEVKYDPAPYIVDMLFPPGEPVRAPIVAVMGEPEVRSSVALRIAGQLTAVGYAVGHVAREGLTLAGTRLKKVPHKGATGVRTLLNNPVSEIVVAEIDMADVIAEGLGFDYCDLAIVTSLGGQLTPFGRPVETVVTGLMTRSDQLFVDSGVRLDQLLGDDPAGWPTVISIPTIDSSVILAAVVPAIGPPPGPQPGRDRGSR